MIDSAFRQTMLTMHRNGQSIRQIAQVLKCSRNTVRAAVRSTGEQETPSVMESRQPVVELLPEIYRRCGGNAVRIQEVLRDEQNLELPYSSLTRMIRQELLRSPPSRVGQHLFAPGEEMQHDTSPHRVMVGGRQVTAHCASLVLAYSRRIFVRYFPSFGRFEVKTFLSDAVRFMEGVCPRCLIDNGSVIVVAGSGTTAQIAPEMVAFAAALGFTFVAHAVRHPQRKGRVERPFHYIEHNFLAGRTFADWDELNGEALRWCQETANQKVKRILGTSPEAAYVMERPHLTSLPEHFPPAFQIEHRLVDLEGYVSLETNRYSVPDRLVGQRMELHKHESMVRILFQGQVVAEHRRMVGRRDGRVTLPGHHQTLPRKASTMPPAEERLLLGLDDTLDAYVAQIKQGAPGRGVIRLRRLLELKRTYPPASFLTAVRTAHQYGLLDLDRLERMILKQVAGDFFELGVG